MLKHTRYIALVLLAFCSIASNAQDFPEGTITPTAADLAEKLTNKAFSVKLKDGTTWRLEYKANGYIFVDTSGGYRGNGTWKVEDGKICSHMRDRDPNCTDVRLQNGSLLLKRPTGEIIQYSPQ